MERTDSQPPQLLLLLLLLFFQNDVNLHSTKPYDHYQMWADQMFTGPLWTNVPGPA